MIHSKIISHDANETIVPGQPHDHRGKQSILHSVLWLGHDEKESRKDKIKVIGSDHIMPSFLDHEKE